MPNWAFANQMIIGPPVTGTASTGGALVMASNSLRAYVIIINTGSTNGLCARFSSTETGCATPIPPLGNYEPFIAPANVIYLASAASTTTYSVKQGQ